MTIPADLDLTINGIRYDIKAGVEATLADVLLDRQQLSGAKRSCSTGACGACTVLADGHPILSCLTLAAGVNGSTIVTVEGLATNETFLPLQNALMALGGSGCGDCIAGMVMSATALLVADPRPTRDDVRLALAGHTCRCLGYEPFVTTILAAAQEIGDDVHHPPARLNTPSPRPASERAALTRHITPAGLAEAVILTSPHPHARIKRIDVAKAKALPGVIAVVTAADLAESHIARLCPSPDIPVLASVTAYVGENIAAVVAEDLSTARRACALIAVEYAVQTHESSPFDEAALDPERKRFSRSPTAITCQINRAIMYEAGGALASWQGEKLTIVTDNAPTPEDRSALFGVSLPGLSEADTDWRGSMPSTIARSCMAGQSVPLAVILAWVVARPVRVHATAGAVASRAAQRVTARISTSRGGAVKSIHVTAHVDSGAYPIGFPPYAIRTGSVFRPGVVKTVVRISPSHTQPPVLIDHNLIEISFALQQAIDMAAKSHAQDPLAFRLRHVELPDVTKGLTEAARRFGWTSKWRGWSPQRQGRKRPGTGLALTGEGTAWVAAFIGLDVDMDVGTVTLGDCTLALICRGASSEEAELATQTGFGNGVAAALFLESTSPPCDRRQLHAGGLYHSRPSTVLDTPVIERLYFDSESVTTPSFSDIASLAAGATVAAIANGIRDATGMAPRTLPMSFDRLRQQWP